MKKNICLLFIFAASFSLSAQQSILQGVKNNQRGAVRQNIPQAVLPIKAIPETADNLQLAISSKDYPVTPGDVYTLTFLIANETVSNTLLVESDYTINMTIFGKLNAAGMTFAQLKPVIEQKIADAYPRSLPSVTITMVGIFQVPIKGNIPKSRYITAWGLSRLSEILEGNLGDYSSVRNVKIISSNGVSRTYDLLKALNLGVLSENPKVRPGDTIIISRASRQIEVRGEIYRPAVYQLLPGEGAADLYAFCGGFTPMADRSRIKINRFSKGYPISMTVNIDQLTNGFKFQDGDIVTVSTIMKKNPIVYIEGGIQAPGVPASGIQASGAAAVNSEKNNEEYNRIVRSINRGETLYDILYSLKDSFSAFADLEHGYIIRENEPFPISVDMQSLIYNYQSTEDIILKPFDHIFIPVRKPTVIVSGAANNPGRYPYNPMENFSFYINLAGGYNPEMSKNGKAIITDKAGKRRNPSEPVKAGDTVNVLTNNFLYNFNLYFPVIATGLTLITTIVTLTNLLNHTPAQ
ncbi:MAG: hypothetical protein GXP33_06670 [Spirochaetes bacterium]|nr:hypothetical protein [Spirochaetota bacterium]